MRQRHPRAGTALGRLTLLAAAATLASCMVGPDYVRPKAEAPAAYKEAESWKLAVPADTVPKGAWWHVYGDADLDALEAQIDVSNQNLAIVEARLRQARAQVQAARAALFPTLGASANASRSRAASRGANISGTNVGSGGGTGNDYNLALDASWEVDLWGGIRRSVEAAQATAQAGASDVEAARLSAQAQLAQSYFMLRVQDAQIKLLNETAAGYARSLKLTQNQYAAGTVARVDTYQAESQLKSTQAQAIDATLQRAQLEHAIAILIGKPPASLTIEPKPLDVRVPLVPVKLPSDLLERRPDIAAAERRAAAANAQIGVAQAAFFPTLGLSASGGLQSSMLSQLLSLPSRYWTLGASLAETIFDAGLRSAQKDVAIAAYDENVATYRQTVLAAFQEVEDNLAALRILEQEAAVQDEAVSAARSTVDVTLNQYKAGIVNYLNVVVVQAAQLNDERSALSILSQRLTASATLIKALGGGWNE